MFSETLAFVVFILLLVALSSVTRNHVTFSWTYDEIRHELTLGK